ncbi:MAG: hypothetical protein ACLTZY_14240 [Alistipes indistinctus]
MLSLPPRCRTPRSVSTADDTDPTAGSPRYTAPIRDTLPERYRFRAFYGNAHSPVVPPAATFDTVLHASSRRTLTFPLSRYTDRNGIWYLTVTPGDPETVINRLDVTGPDTTYAIIRNGQKVNPFSPAAPVYRQPQQVGRPYPDDIE